MFNVRAVELPANALLQRHARPGNYHDCFVVEIAGAVTLQELMQAFFSTPLFRLERLIIRLTTRQSATDVDVAAIASAETKRFAMWLTEAREPEQLLMRVGRGPIRSWWMVAPGAEVTRLYFGSAILGPAPERASGSPWYRRPADALHRLYARLLLAQAARMLKARP